MVQLSEQPAAIKAALAQDGNIYHAEQRSGDALRIHLSRLSQSRTQATEV